MKGEAIFHPSRSRLFPPRLTFRSCFSFLTVLFGLLAGSVLWGQETEYQIRPDGSFVQILRWVGQEDVLYYEVEIEKQEGELWEKTLTEKTELSFCEVSLDPGIYRCLVRAYDVLERPRQAAGWIQFEVLAAKQPELLRFSPEAFYLDEDVIWVLDLFGNNFTSGIEVFLNSPQGKIVRPDTVTVERPGNGVRLVFDYRKLEAGEYTIHAVNPGGLTADLGIFKITFRKPVDIGVSAGYRPMAALYGRINELLETNFFPIGAYSRLSLIPLKRQWGYMGFELESSWVYLLVTGNDYKVQAQMPGGILYGVYQRWFSNRIMVLNFRIGGGVYAVLDYHFISNGGKAEPATILLPVIATGVSFQWFIRKPLFVEAGLDFTHLFTEDKPSPGYLRPFIGVGWQF
ncbi:MAG: hypothetical protein LBE14_01520 [Treponema sp.]|nr:hypothetical protein [Treponema sp.]